jgi:hypothetical protein
MAVSSHPKSYNCPIWPPSSYNLGPPGTAIRSCGGRRGLVTRDELVIHDVELDPVDQGVGVDRPGMGGPVS